MENAVILIRDGKIAAVGTDLEIPVEARPWTGEKRFAGLSSFGFGGTNSHIVLSAAPVKKIAENAVERPQHLLCLAAKAPDALNHMNSQREVNGLKRLKP